MTKAQVDRRVLSIFQALLQEHGRSKVEWCEQIAQQARMRLMREARKGKTA